MKKCEKCNKEHDGRFGSGRFCSIQCSNSRNLSRKTYEEISRKLKYLKPMRYVDKNCVICGEKFKVKYGRRTKKTCSRICSNISMRVNVSKKMKEMHLAGLIKRWNINRSSLSYAEKFFKRVLDNNDIKYKIDFLAGKYFIDFAIRDKKIALEIDGKQHEQQERKESDARKDKFLKNNDWLVYRIKWKSINNLKGREYIKNEIDKFLDFYASVA